MHRDVRAIVCGSSTFGRVAVLQMLARQGVEVVASSDEFTAVAREPDAIVVALQSERDLEYLHLDPAVSPRSAVRVAVYDERQPELAHRAAAAGAAVVVDHQSAAWIVDLIDAAASGHAAVPRFVLDRLTRPDPSGARVGEVELRWLERLDAGITVARLAEEVGVSERIVHRQLHDLYVRLGVDSCSEALDLVRGERRFGPGRTSEGRPAGT